MVRPIRNSAKALIIKEKCIAVVKIKDNGEDLYTSKLRKEIIKLYNSKPYNVYLGDESREFK
jgi:hypothetical protein